MTEDLTEAQREELRLELEALVLSLRAVQATTSELAQTVELDQAAVGRLSRMDAIQQQKMAAAQKQRNALRMKQVAVALQAFADDAYGDCKLCGEPIGYRRLKARPESPCCVPCMSEIE